MLTMVRALTGKFAILAVCLVGTVLLPSVAHTQYGSYRPIWSGYAAVTTCVSGKDAYALGPYVFTCSGYDYPYHYGDVVLLATTITYGGRSMALGRLCLEGVEACLEGQIYIGAGAQSAEEFTEDCRSARESVDQSRSNLDSAASSLQQCLRRNEYDDDCGSKFRNLKSEFSTHENNVSQAQNDCR